MNNTKFTKTHEWVRINDDNTITVGITDHAQHALGDIVFVELPNKDTSITVGKECMVVESVKSASDVYAPLNGTIIAVNEALTSTPALINQDPQNQGWLFKVQPSNLKELDDLMNDQEYEDYLRE